MLIQIRPPPTARPIVLSKNGKTGYSINTAIRLTCRPTRACWRYCYGKQGPIAFPRSVTRQVENTQRFESFARHVGNSTTSLCFDEMSSDVDRIGFQVLRHQRFLRFFGVGDLSVGSVAFINEMSVRHPNLQLWVATRQIQLASTVACAVNIHLMLSVDATTSRCDLSGVRNEIKKRKGQAFAAWVQQTENEKIPKWVEVIFAEHHGRFKARWTKRGAATDPRTCPATIDGGNAHGACSRCQRCFDVDKRRSHRAKAKHSTRKTTDD